VRALLVGIDAAFSNMGFARMQFDSNEKPMQNLLSLHLESTEGQHKKEVRKSSDDLRRARQLYLTMCRQCEGALFAIAEVPSGSQSSRASWSLGIAVGVLASCPITLLQVSQLEVKMASVGKKTASKDEMIEWAMSRYPHAGWLLHKGRPVKANEHLADAVAIIHAGMQTDTFRLALPVFERSTRVKLK